MFPWGLFPFNEQMMKKFKKMQPEEIENYVQQLIKEMIPKEKQNLQWMYGHDSEKKEEENNDLDISVFQTHEDIYVLVSIVDEAALVDMKIYHTTNELMIDYSGGKKKVPLPSLVTKKGAKAVYKDGILEIKLPRSMGMHVSEINIRNEQ